MADFGKLNYSVSLKPTSAFPLDARCYFESLAEAQEAALTAEEVGSTNTVYYYGQKVVVVADGFATWYTIQPDKTLKVDSAGGTTGTAKDSEKLGGQLPSYYAKAEDIPEVPTEVSAFKNDKGYLTGETDPTVPSWAKEPNIPVYTAGDVGADAEGTASNLVSSHNTGTDAHNDIRLLIQGLTERINTVANSDDVNLDQLGEIVAYIKNNKNLIDGITTSKVNYSDIINNLTTNVSDKPLSAAMGVTLKALIDAIVVPTKVSQLENDKGYITQHQDLSSYAKKSEIPTIPSSLPANGGNADTVDGYHIRKVTDTSDTGQTGYITFIV